MLYKTTGVCSTCASLLPPARTKCKPEPHPGAAQAERHFSADTKDLRYSRVLLPFPREKTCWVFSAAVTEADSQVKNDAHTRSIPLAARISPSLIFPPATPDLKRSLHLCLTAEPELVMLRNGAYRSVPHPTSHPSLQKKKRCLYSD